MSQRVNTASNAISSLYDKLDRLMAKAKPNKREQVQQRFRDLYPKMEAYLALGKPLKNVLAAFNELAQAKVCTRTFNEMLSEERARRDQGGNPAFCETCGQQLRHVLVGTLRAESDQSESESHTACAPELE